MSGNNPVLTSWQRISVNPGGKRIFSRLLGYRSPFSASIQPTVEVLSPGHVEVSIRKRRAVLDHVGNVHSGAMCNMAELTGGLMTEVSIPSTHQWVTRSMTVEYLQEADTDLVAVSRARLRVEGVFPSEQTVPVEIRNLNGVLVFHARLSMWITHRRSS